ncbi:MAG TPA: L,D-transpeptidase family protein [Acidimicrobiia bacterium]|nr:L,D-transpeptidase family protein [Acidimicrobiia bacterium]
MRRASLALALALFVAGCGNPAEVAQVVEPVAAPSTTVTPAPTAPAAPSTTLPRPEPTFGGLSAESLPAHRTLVAMTVGDTEIYETRQSTEATLTMPHTTILGTVTVLEVVEGPVDGWARVRLPIRPNGSEGWIKSRDLMLYMVEGKVEIDLSERTLTYFEDGREILTTSVAVGSQRNPTPEGEFFITDSVTLDNPASPWGPHAFGLSARSDTITDYNGGDGIIGIHGTNRPGSIGNAASLGCVRVPNDVITRLHEMVPIGTPVEITA